MGTVLGETPETVAVIVTVWLLLSGPAENPIAASPLLSVVTLDEALNCPPVEVKVTVVPSIMALVASNTVAVIVALSELSDFTVV